MVYNPRLLVEESSRSIRCDTSNGSKGTQSLPLCLGGVRYNIPSCDCRPGPWMIGYILSKTGRFLSLISQ